MPKIVIRNIANTVLESNENDATMLEIIHKNYVDWMHACGGKGRCTTCKMIVIKGENNLSEKSDFETKMSNLDKLKSNERLACQCKLLEGEVEITVPQENQLPHIEYLKLD